MKPRLPHLSDLQPRERLLAIVSGVIVLIVLLDRLVLGPWSTHTRAVRQEIAQMEQALQRHQRLLARQDRVMAELDRYQRYLTPAIADDLQMAVLLKEVEDLAGKSHVKVAEIKPLAVEADETAKRYPLDVRFECTLEEWVEFVYSIETSPSLFEIVRAGLSVQEDVPDRLDASLRLVSAFMREDRSPEHPDEEGTHATSTPAPSG